MEIRRPKFELSEEDNDKIDYGNKDKQKAYKENLERQRKKDGEKDFPNVKGPKEPKMF